MTTGQTPAKAPRPAASASSGAAAAATSSGGDDGKLSWATAIFLQAWLEERGVDVSGSWGSGGAKTVEALFAEVKAGDCVLSESTSASGAKTALRVVNVARVAIVD